ncbi:MAG: transporter substrate-binding domain-containing protein [Kiritimatiellae bacterium]|nr:transporter substrate-binding domain-containing protein [Kiritimatiellia bacterium]
MVDKITMIGVVLLLMATGCGKKTEAPAPDLPAPETTPGDTPAEERVAPDTDYIETGDLAVLQKRGCLRFLILRQDEQYLPRAGDPPNREVELAVGFCASIGVRPAAVFVETRANLTTALLAGKGDLIASYMTPTETLKKKLSFSAPLFSYREVIAGRLSTAALKQITDLKGHTLAVQKETAQWDTAQALNRRYPEIRLQVLPETLPADAILDALAAGKLDLVLTDDHSLGIARQYRSDFKSVLDLGIERGLVWGARPGNVQLLAALNSYLKQAPLAARNAAVYREDWPQIKKRKILRMITVNTAATYFLWKGELKGFEYEMAGRFAKQNGLQLEVIVADDYDALIPMLLAGQGDFIAAFLTITDERRARGVEFSVPYNYAAETVVARTTERRIKTIQDLAGREVMAARSSYPWTLLGNLRAQGIKVNRRAAPSGAQPDDMLEWVAEGKIDLTVVDDQVLAMALGWLDGVKMVLTLGTPQPEGWVARAQDKQLLKSINGFWKKEYRSTDYNIAYNRYFKSASQIRKAVQQQARLYRDGSISPYDPLVRRFAGMYNFDWRLIVAQMFQESRFDPNVVSPSGARGLMQVMPSTAKEMGFRNVKDPPTGIHAGVKYLDTMQNRGPQELDASNRVYFALASYNAGAGHVMDARILARQMGRNPNLWFGNVEDAMRLLSKPEYARRAKCGFVRGQEPINYVRQIVARYRTYMDLIEQQKADKTHPALKP